MSDTRIDPVYPDSLESSRHTMFHTAYELHGSGNPDLLFGEKDIAIAPWPKAGRLKKQPMYDHEAVRHALSTMPQLEGVDPRALHATQGWVTRGGVNYYLGQGYQQTGRTFADRENVGNQYPVVYSDQRGRNLLLSGHHRATAALLRGVPLQARRVQGNV